MHYSQKISIKIRMRSLTGAQMGNVILQAIIDSRSAKIPMGIAWPVDKFDMREEKLLLRFDDDEECYQHNLVLVNEKAKANKLILRYYTAENY